MKKILSFTIALAMLMSAAMFVIPAQAMGENETFPMLYETYESEKALKTVSTQGPCSAKLSISPDGYNGSAGSLRFLQTAGTDYVDISYFADEKGLQVPDGEQLQLRMKIKSNVELANNYFTFIFYGNGTVSDPGATGKKVGEKTTGGWLEIVFNGALKHNEWVDIRKDIVWGEQTLTVGSGSKLTDVTLTKMAIRVGNRSGINTDVKGEKLDYQIDDLSIMLAPSSMASADSVGNVEKQNYSATNTPVSPSRWGNPDMTSVIKVKPGRLYKITGNFRCDTLPEDTEGYTDDMKPTKANLRIYWLGSSRLDNGLTNGDYPSTYISDLKLNEDNNLTIYYLADGQTFSFPEGFELKFRMYTDAKDRTWKDGALQATNQGGSNAGTAGKFTYSNVTYEDLGMATGINYEVQPGEYYVRNSTIQDTAKNPVIGYADNGSSIVEVMNEDGNRFVKSTGNSNYGSITSGGVMMKNKHTYRINVKAKTEGLAEGESKPFTVILNRDNQGLSDDADYPYKTANYHFLTGDTNDVDHMCTENHKWFVTNEWQTFTMNYTVDAPLKEGMSESVSTMPISPKLQFRLGQNAEQQGAVLYLDDISVSDMGILDESAQGTGKYASVSDIRFEQVGKCGIKVDYTYRPNENEQEDRTKTLIRAFIETEKGDRNLGTFTANEVFNVPASALGKAISFEVFPVSTEGYVGNGAQATCDFIFDVQQERELKINTNKTEATWTLDVNSAQGAEKSYLVGVAAYGADNSLIATDVAPYAIVGGANNYSDVFAIPVEAVKVKMFVWDAVTLSPQFEVLEENLPQAVEDPFEGDDEVNIVFIGDSLYANAGAGVEQNGFVYQVGEWMKENYAKEGRTINWYNTSYGGTTTDYSFVRFQRDVLSKNPDMIFFSMTCNDGGGTDTYRNVESCIRMVNELENKPYMVLTLLTNRSFGNSTEKTKKLADFYDLAYFDNFEAQRAAVAAGTAVEDLYIADGVHPNPAGYKMIADALNEWIGTNRNFTRPADREDKLVANSGTIANMDVFAAKNESRVTRTGDWTDGGNYLVTKTVGSTLEFDFEGDILCFETALHQYAGRVEVYVDGEYVWTDDPYYNMAGHQMTVRNGNFNFDLPAGQHHVVLKVVDGQNTAEQMETRIYNIFAGSWK